MSAQLLAVLLHPCLALLARLVDWIPESRRFGWWADCFIVLL